MFVRRIIYGVLLALPLLFISVKLALAQGGDTCTDAKANSMPLPWSLNDTQVCKVNDDFDKSEFGTKASCDSYTIDDGVSAGLDIGEWLYHFSSPVNGVVEINISDFRNAGASGSLNSRNGSFTIIQRCPGSAEARCLGGFGFDSDLIDDFKRVFAIEANVDYYLLVENRSLPLFQECIQFDLSIGFTPEFVPTPSVSAACENSDFSTGNLTAWTQVYGHTGVADEDDGVPLFSPISTGGNPDYTGQIHSGGTDPRVGSVLPRVRPGSTHSYQIGTDANSLTNQLGTKNIGERLTQTFVVESDKSTYSYSYALVQQGNFLFAPHATTFFSVNFKDENGDEIPCTTLVRATNVTGIGASETADPPFVKAPSGAPVFSSPTPYYTDWITENVDLTEYIGQEVTVEFTAGSAPYHSNRFSYAYIDASCGPTPVYNLEDREICSGESTDLVAPPGYASYTWQPGNFSGQTYTVSPSSTTTYMVELTNGSGCTKPEDVTVTVNTCTPPDPCSLNLVRNGSFEDVQGDPNICLNQGCGFGGEALRRADYWDSYAYSCDLFVPNSGSGCSSVWLPGQNPDQSPEDGNHYVGFQAYYPYSSSNPNFPDQYGTREFFGTELCCPLVKDVPYRVKGHFKQGRIGRFTINKLGFRFQNNPKIAGNNQCGVGEIDYAPAHIWTDNLVGSYWTEVSGVFVADKSYTHLLGGVFARHNEITFVDADNNPSSSNPAYYSADNISVEPLGAWIQNNNYATEVTINSGESVMLEAFGSGTFLWSPASGLDDPTIKTPTATPSATITYTVSVDLGCSVVTTSVTINVVDACTGTVDAGPNQTINAGDVANLNAIPTGGTPMGYTWTANPADASLTDPTSQNPTVSPTQTTTYTVEANFGGSCTVSDPITITVVNPVCALALDNSGIQTNNTDCNLTNGSITGILVSGNSGSETYSWTNSLGAEVGTSNDLIGIGAGTYSLTVTDGNCVTTSGSYTIEENCPAPCQFNLTTSITEADCGQSNGSASVIVTGGTPPYDFSWLDSNKNEISASNILNDVSSGTYHLTISDTNACDTTAIVEIDVAVGALPTVNLGGDRVLCEGNSLRLDATQANATYLWQDSSTSPSYEVTQAGLYHVVVTNNCGQATDEVSITVETCGETEPMLRIANTITPNGDGDNDTFYIENIALYPYNHLIIFNRWGRVIYETNGYKNQWSGTHNGKEVPLGTYYYVLNLNDEGKQVFKGSVSVLR